MFCWTWRRSWPSTTYSLSSSAASLASSSSVRSRARLSGSISGPLAELIGQERPDAVDVAQRDDRSLVVGDVDAQNTRHPSGLRRSEAVLGVRSGVATAPTRRRGAPAGQPCLCLCLGLDLQITKTFPARRTILQLSQIRLTLDRTFMAVATFVLFRLSALIGGVARVRRGTANANGPRRSGAASVTKPGTRSASPTASAPTGDDRAGNRVKHETTRLRRLQSVSQPEPKSRDARSPVGPAAARTRLRTSRRGVHGGCQGNRIIVTFLVKFRKGLNRPSCQDSFLFDDGDPSLGGRRVGSLWVRG